MNADDLTMQAARASAAIAGISLDMCPANERCCYIVMTSLIGWAHTWTDPWIVFQELGFHIHPPSHCQAMIENASTLKPLI